MDKVKNVAVFIDAENVPSYSAKQIFDLASNYGNVTVKRIFADWSKGSVKAWKDEVNRYSMTAVQQFEVQPRKTPSTSRLSFRRSSCCSKRTSTCSASPRATAITPAL